MKQMLWILLFGGVLIGSGCGGDGRDDEDEPLDGPAPPLEQARNYRAIAGVSMGGYGAMNLGTKRSDLFGTIASLGGPVDMTQLLQDSIEDNLEVKSQTAIPRNVDDDFTFDHLAPYPDRDTRISMLQDLAIAFGNPMLHHPDPARKYLASDSEPAQKRSDDVFGSFVIPTNIRGFLDGGDSNDDGLRQTLEMPTKPVDVALVAGGSLARIVPGASGVNIGERALADLNGDGIYDVGDGLVINLSEPFADGNSNLVYEPGLGESYSDSGLDGVAGTADFGEGNGQFDYDPDRAKWLDEDPLTRITETAASELSTQRIYMDVGLRDEFEFARHYDNLVAALQAKGLTVAFKDGFSEKCQDLPKPDAQFLLVRYDSGHIGVDSVDPDDLIDGNPCGNDTVWQRILSMIGFLNQSFPDGYYGAGDFDGPDIDLDDLDVDFPDLDPTGDVRSVSIDSPALTVTADSPVKRQAVIYRPPAYFHSDETFPVVYFLGGYGQEPDDFVRMGELLDVLILSEELQNMFFVFLPGDGGRQGSFYVNHSIADSQVPEITSVTSGRYEDSMLMDLIPQIEEQYLRRRVKH